VELLLVCAMVALVAGFVTRPLRAPAPGSASGRLRALEDARDAKLREIRDAELDLRMGKLEPADHRVLDARLRAEAAALLRRLDAAREEART
jgi:hypothetical protein